MLLRPSPSSLTNLAVWWKERSWGLGRGVSIHPLCRGSRLSASLVGPPTMFMSLSVSVMMSFRSMLQKVPGRAQGLTFLGFLFLHGTAEPKTFELADCSKIRSQARELEFPVQSAQPRWGHSDCWIHPKFGLGSFLLQESWGFKEVWNEYLWGK